MADNTNKKYFGKKIQIHEEFLKDIKAHNRKLVSDKNSLIDQLAQAEEKIFQLNSKIEVLQEEILNLKQDQESISKIQEKKEEFNHEEDFEPIHKHKSKEMNNTLQNKPNIANNFQTKTIYGKRNLTEMELEIIAYLRRKPHSYMDLRGKIRDTNERALAVHLSNLRKYFGIEVQRIRKHKINFYYIDSNQVIEYSNEIENFEMINQEKFYIN